MSAYILVLVTAASAQEADKIAQALVEQHLVACANIIPNLRSVFWWQQAIATEQEMLIVLKSTASHFPAIVTTVKSLHSYQTPEIIALPIIAGSEDYLQWISDATQTPPQ